MTLLTEASRILLATQPDDFRKGIDGLGFATGSSLRCRLCLYQGNRAITFLKPLC